MPTSTEKPFLLFVSLGYEYGGAETYYVKLAKILVPHFRLLAITCCAGLAKDLSALGIETVLSAPAMRGAARYRYAMWEALKMVARYPVHAVHLNGQPESYLGLPLKCLGLNVLSTRHTPFTDLFLKEGSRVPIFLKRWMVLLSLHAACSIFCVSRLIETQLSKYLPPSRLNFVPTWVTPMFLEDGLQTDTASTKTGVPFRLLFVGRVVKNKGIFDLIEAVRGCPGLLLTVAGDGQDMGLVKERSKGLPVEFVGFQADCRPFYRNADLLVFPSSEGFEGLPQVPLESMAMGLPCLGSDISSMKEISGEEMCAALYRAGDVEALRSSIQWLQHHPEERTRLSKSGLKRVLDIYQESAIERTYIDTFSKYV
ncbi:MAG: glycosyltransferase family 4 protein [Acidobacteria bacterium]|nr:glycosyltransferase family 4 protein [Acidobacteriota bacterium]